MNDNFEKEPNSEIFQRSKSTSPISSTILPKIKSHFHQINELSRHTQSPKILHEKIIHEKLEDRPRDFSRQSLQDKHHNQTHSDINDNKRPPPADQGVPTNKRLIEEEHIESQLLSLDFHQNSDICFSSSCSDTEQIRIVNDQIVLVEQPTTEEEIFQSVEAAFQSSVENISQAHIIKIEERDELIVDQSQPTSSIHEQSKIRVPSDQSKIHEVSHDQSETIIKSQDRSNEITSPSDQSQKVIVSHDYPEHTTSVKTSGREKFDSYSVANQQQPLLVNKNKMDEKSAHEAAILSSRSPMLQARRLNQVKAKLEEVQSKSEHEKPRRKITEHERPLYYHVMKETIAEYEKQKLTPKFTPSPRNSPFTMRKIDFHSHIQTIDNTHDTDRTLKNAQISDNAQPSDMQSAKPLRKNATSLNFLEIMQQKLCENNINVDQDYGTVKHSRGKRRSVHEPAYAAVIRQTLIDYEKSKKEHQQNIMEEKPNDSQSSNSRISENRQSPNLMNMLERKLSQQHLINKNTTGESSSDSEEESTEPLYAQVIKAALKEHRKSLSCCNKTNQQTPPKKFTHQPSISEEVEKHKHSTHSRSSSDISAASEEVKEISKRFFTSANRNANDIHQPNQNFSSNTSKPALPQIPTPDYAEEPGTEITHFRNHDQNNEIENRPEECPHPHHIPRMFWNPTSIEQSTGFSSSGADPPTKQNHHKSKLQKTSNNRKISNSSLINDVIEEVIESEDDVSLFVPVSHKTSKSAGILDIKPCRQTSTDSTDSSSCSHNENIQATNDTGETPQISETIPDHRVSDQPGNVEIYSGLTTDPQEIKDEVQHFSQNHTIGNVTSFKSDEIEAPTSMKQSQLIFSEGAINASNELPSIPPRSTISSGTNVEVITSSKIETQQVMPASTIENSQQHLYPVVDRSTKPSHAKQRLNSPSGTDSESTTITKSPFLATVIPSPDYSPVSSPELRHANQRRAKSASPYFEKNSACPSPNVDLEHVNDRSPVPLERKVIQFITEMEVEVTDPLSTTTSASTLPGYSSSHSSCDHHSPNDEGSSLSQQSLSSPPSSLSEMQSRLSPSHNLSSEVTSLHRTNKSESRSSQPTDELPPPLPDRTRKPLSKQRTSQKAEVIPHLC